MLLNSSVNIDSSDCSETSEDLAQDERKISTGKFYSSKGYIPPLERKRRLDQVKSPDIEPKQSKRSRTEKSIKGQPKKIKTSKKNTKTLRSDQSKKKPSAETSLKSVLTPKLSGQKSHSETVSLSSVLAKKEPNVEPQKRKFFKSRSEPSNNVLLRLENIIPKNSKGIIEHKLNSESKKPKARDKENVTLETPLKSSASDLSSCATPQKSEMPTKWVINSFVSDSPRSCDNCDVNDKVQIPEKNPIGDDSGNKTIDTTVLTAEDDFLDSTSADVYPLFRNSSNKENSSKSFASCINEKVKASKPSNSLPKTMLPKGKELFTLDAGQEMGPVVCPQCPIMYQKGSTEDEHFHEKKHKELTSTYMKFQGWKKEHVIGNFLDGRIIMVTKDDKNYMIEKVDKILEVVSRDLGTDDQNVSFKLNDVFLLYVHMDLQIIGCLLAEPITKAHYIKDIEHPNRNSNDEENGKDRRMSRSEPVKALCGINMLWVADGFDQDIAFRMIDCLRCNFAYGFLVQDDQLAFLDASERVLRFAAAYTKKENFLIYK